MNILLAYTTNSGGTQMAGEIVAEVLTSKGHTVTVKKINETQAEEFANFDVIILGSPSWWIGKKDGQPPEAFQEFMTRCEGKSFNSQKFVVLGLGDRGYINFCGAVNVLEEFVKSHGGQLAAESLRIDGFYFNAKNSDIVREWAEKLPL